MPGMKSMKSALLTLLVTSALGAAVPASAEDLAEVYQRALRSDPVLREAEANRLATLESRPQALANLLPQLNATGSWTREDQDFETLQQFTPNQVTAIRRESDTDTTQWNLQLRQTLFRWEQFALYRAAGVEVAQAEVDFRNAQQDVITRAATAYFNVLAARDTLEAGEAAREAIARQLEQADKRFEVGLIAITDVQEARAASDQANATVIEGKRALANARERLRELTGDLFDTLERPGDDMPLLAPDPASEEDWVKAALDQNLALQSARLGAEIARENIAAARGGHFPAVDLVASRGGFDVDGDTTTTALGQSTSFPAQQDSDDTSIGVQVTFPIYAGGAVSSRVREAVYRQRAARERLERTARETERQTRDAYLNVLSGIARVQSLKQLVESNQVALQATEAGYEVGTRTAVDVLQSRQRLFQAQSDYARTRYDYVLNVLALERAAGTLDEDRVLRVNGWLNEPVAVK
jgi:outer membrane protein